MHLSKVAAVCTLSLLFSSLSSAQQFKGKVTSLDGEAIAQAKISLVNGQQQTVTDEQGYFVFEGFPEGVGEKVELHISAKNFSHLNQQLALDKLDNDLVVFTLIPSVMEVVDVYATPLHSSSIESALPVNVITGDDLRLKQASTLGETLKNEVGVHSTYYGPVASSPIIRGLDGPRVMVTQNGLDVGDASRVGPDHVVSSETSTATQIEVLRGPATLFYGSGAIGGVVNVVDNRVPTSIDPQIDYMIKHNDVADENEASFNINTGVKSFAFHLDGFWRESNDFHIPGYAELSDEHEEDHHDDDHDDDEHEDREHFGKLFNSASKSSGFTFGSSYLMDNGFIGFSFGTMSREYGIPGHDEHGDEHDEGHHLLSESDHEEKVKGDLNQDRFQLLSDLTFDDNFINRVATKVAYTDYQHQELEGDHVGTEFTSEMLETRFDMYHQEINGWSGAWTMHYKDTDFKAIGEEAFTPPSTTETLAGAWLEEKHFGPVLVQLGVRFEHVEINADIDFFNDEEHHEEPIPGKQIFNPLSSSLGLVWDYTAGYNVGFSFAFSQRAPSAGELYSNGPHIGTNTYEVGALYEVHQEGDEVHIELSDDKPELETSYNMDITWRKFDGDLGFVVSAFYNQFQDYYYLENTGIYTDDIHQHGENDLSDEDEHGLPLYIYQQSDVDMYGIESELIYQLTPTFKTSIFADYIRAEFSDGGYLPRIPPMRIGGKLDYQGDRFAASVNVNHYFEQDKVADLETTSDAYTILDANVNYYLDGIGNDLVFFVKGDNLTDEEARVHSSFLKNSAPLPGRGISFGLRGSF